MRIIGCIHSVDIKNKLISIRTYKRLTYLYFQTSQMHLFKRYLYEGVYIEAYYDEDKVFYKNGIDAYIIDYVMQIYRTTKYQRINYFNIQEINDSLSKFLSSLGNMLFLDLEMTMPSYGHAGKEYKAEIIQAGYLLVDNNGEEICRYSNYIKPVLNPILSKRTLKFLNIEQSEFNSKAILYKEFYEEFKEVIELYHPTIIVYGKNDSIILKNSFRINSVKSITDKVRFVNLCKLVRNYYNLRNDAGLFKLYQIYYENDDLQLHDAFTDCYVTKEVFQAFKNDVKRLTNNYDKIRINLEP